MIMKTRFTIQKSSPTGSALMLVLIMSAIALAILAGVMSWSATSSRLTHRSIQYTRSVAAAEAATEKVASQITRDFLSGGEQLVSQNLDIYRQNTVPSSSDSSYWNTWEFNDGNGNLSQTYVQRVPGTSYTVLDAPYKGLKGYVSTYTVVSHARDTASPQDVTGGVLEELQLAGIPIFQFGMYSSGNMEISCGQPFDVTGHVHSNGKLYVEPDNSLTFESDVTAVVNVLFQRDPLDTRHKPAGGVVYVQTNSPSFPVAALTLPIGTSNTPEAIREIIEPPPSGEDPNSSLGRSRWYYNKCDLVLVVSNNWALGARSGGFNNFSSNELAQFVSTANSFWDAREGKTVRPIDIDIGALKTWSETNLNLRSALIGSNLSSIYVVDNRTLPATSLGAVRVCNGLQLPTNGLTVATGRPLYVWKDYNTDSVNRGSTNTSTTRPASLVADAITILSDAWQDGNSTSEPNAAATTVNAAFLTGVVETTLGHYSGGMENFPRFLESWGPTIFTYNGSMIKMFPSLYATNVWGKPNVYDPPARNWAYDANFNDPTKLPPKTPSLLKVIRSQWATVPSGTNVATTIP
jgi:Tfp pilus assembly protein PilX